MNKLLPIIALSLVLMFAGCGPSPAATPTSPPPTETSEPANTPVSTSDDPQPVVLGMGFIPNVQFAPFYVADSRGYFAEEGIKVQFNYGTEDDLLKLIGTDKLQFAIGSGDQVILAQSQELPAVYVANFYRQFPVSVASLADQNITTPKDLEGKKVGVPGLYGASYIGWLALSHAAQIDDDKVSLQTIGYTQAAALQQGLVDAAVVYIMNTPVQLELEGEAVSQLKVSDYLNVVSNGIITNEQTIDKNPQLVQGMVRAFLRGLRDTLDDPEAALEITLEYVPESGGENRKVTEAVLQASIELWQGEDLGISERDDWVVSADFMKQVGLIEQIPDVDKLFTNKFVPAASD